MWIKPYHEIIDRFPWRDDGDDDGVVPPAPEFMPLSACLVSAVKEGV